MKKVIALVAAAPVVAWFAAVHLGSYPLERLRPSDAASLVVLDSAGGVLRQQATAAGERERWVPLSAISPHLQDAVVAAEDRRFRDHGGVDPVGVTRAVWLNLRARRIAFGGSTITMQLVRMVDRQARRRLGAKLGQAVDAARLERVLSKDQILEQYLNRAYFGNGVWGAEAASRFYFGKPAADLSLGEAAFLAVLPRGPSLYDPYRHLPRTLARRKHILAQMESRGFTDAAARILAEQTPVRLVGERPDFRAPHFVDHVLSQLEEGGGVVETTLDGPLQQRLEVALREHLAAVGGRRVGQAGLVVLRNSDGAVLAMVGSRNYFDAEHAGAANVLTLRRRPGSTLKPFVYGLAIENGDTAATVAYDQILPGESRQSYTVDIKQHGPAPYREALAGSYNLAAVHTLARVGPQALLERLRRAGVGTLDRPDEQYGVTLAIGDAEVRVLDLAAAFAAFGNQGRPIRPRAIQASTPTVEEPIFSPAVAYLIFHILSDPDARRPMFGSEAPVFSFPVALKTGTTRAYTDNLAFGTTAEFTVGAWAGNFDGSPTDGMMAMFGAAPLVRAAFGALSTRFGPPTAPHRPAGLVDAMVCGQSGLSPGRSCPGRRSELFIAGTEPDERCSGHGRREAPAAGAFRILYPAEGARFYLDSTRPAAYQRPPLRAASTGHVRWTIDGLPSDRWIPTPGVHVVEAEQAGQRDRVRIRYDL